MEQFLYTVSVWALPVLLAITLHEAAHGYAAKLFGDPTAYMMGRVTLNPLKHIDPFGTVLLPALLMTLQSPLLIGYAKPVPVNFRLLSNPKHDMIFVAFAGPLMNFILAILGVLLLKTLPFLPENIGPWAAQNLSNLIFFNLIIAFFNLIPIPPLDGGRILVGILPQSLSNKVDDLEPYGFFIVLGLLFFGPYVGLHIFEWFVRNPTVYTLHLLANLGL